MWLPPRGPARTALCSKLASAIKPEARDRLENHCSQFVFQYFLDTDHLNTFKIQIRAERYLYVCQIFAGLQAKKMVTTVTPLGPPKHDLLIHYEGLNLMSLGNLNSQIPSQELAAPQATLAATGREVKTDQYERDGKPVSIDGLNPVQIEALVKAGNLTRTPDVAEQGKADLKADATYLPHADTLKVATATPEKPELQRGVLIAGASIEAENAANQVGSGYGANRTYNITDAGTGRGRNDGDTKPTQAVNQAALNQVDAFASSINGAANAYGLYPLTVAAVLFEEQRRYDPGDKRQDDYASEILTGKRRDDGFNDSIGLVQMKPSTLRQIVQAGWIDPGAFSSIPYPNTIQRHAAQLKPEVFNTLNPEAQQKILLDILLDPKSAVFALAAGLAWCRKRNGNEQTMSGSGPAPLKDVVNSAQYSILTQQYQSLDRQRPPVTGFDPDTSERRVRGFLADRNAPFIDKYMRVTKPTGAFSGW